MSNGSRDGRDTAIRESVDEGVVSTRSVEAEALAAGALDADRELLDAASDLVAWGADAPASRLIATLRSRGDRYRSKLDSLEQVISEARDIGDEFGTRMYADAVETASNPGATIAELIKAADDLVVWGALDEAEVAIARIEKNESIRHLASNLRAVSDQLRKSGVLEALSPAPGGTDSPFNGPSEALFARGEGPSGTAIVVFTGAQRRFWVSLQVLHHILRRRADHIVYLGDHSATLFLNGLRTVAPSYRELVGYLRSNLKRLGALDIRVMATSAGGFVGLRLATDLPANAFLGFGIRTSFRQDLPLGGYDESALRRCRDPEMLIDLRGYVASRFAPVKIALFAGRSTQIDSVHAEHMQGITRAKVTLVDSARHDTVGTLIGRGEFGAILDDFMA